MKKINEIIIYRLYESHKHKMINLAWGYVKDKSQAEEIVQDAFERLIKYLENQDSIPDEQHLEALIVLATKQIALNKYADSKKRNEVNFNENLDSQNNNSFESILVNQDFAKELYTVLLQQLDSEHLDMMMMKYGFGYRSAFIAEKYQISENYVNQILMRTKKRAQKLLEPIYEY